MQGKSANFVLCSRELSMKVRAIIRWNKGRYFVEFSVPRRYFAIISDISLADTRNFAWNRIVVLQRSCKVLHATDTIGWSHTRLQVKKLRNVFKWVAVWGFRLATDVKDWHSTVKKPGQVCRAFPKLSS